MEAAKQLMPVTELDNYAGSKLHMLIHHLQCASTLEYDRLDAKLLLLPQMARLGRKSAEVDAWMQALVENASYLYDELEISDASRWDPAAAAAAIAAAAGGATAASSQPVQLTLMRSSLNLSSAGLAKPSPAAAAAAAAAAPMHQQGGVRDGSWVFPDPLKGTSHASRSRVNVATQPRPPLRVARVVPAAVVTLAEWAAIAAIMDPARHAALLDVWTRLRPLMTGGAAQPAAADSGRAWSVCATANGSSEPKQSAPLSVSAAAPAPADTLGYGALNCEVLDVLHQDLAAMASPDFAPPPPSPAAKLPPHRGHRKPLAAVEAPAAPVPRPVRCRGEAEVPLPPTYAGMDLWGYQSKACETAYFVSGSPGEAPGPGTHQGAGATPACQEATLRLQAAREVTASQRTAVRMSMQLAKGAKPYDDGSDGERAGGTEVDPKSPVTRRVRVRVHTMPHPRPHPHPHPDGGGGVSGGRSKHQQCECGNGSGSAPAPAPASSRGRPSGAVPPQATEYRGQPTPEERPLAVGRDRAAAEAVESLRWLLCGNGGGGRSHEQILEEALRAAESAVRSLGQRQQ